VLSTAGSVAHGEHQVDYEMFEKHWRRGTNAVEEFSTQNRIQLVKGNINTLFGGLLWYLLN
jgi:hypothetical protein